MGLGLSPPPVTPAVAEKLPEAVACADCSGVGIVLGLCPQSDEMFRRIASQPTVPAGPPFELPSKRPGRLAEMLKTAALLCTKGTSDVKGPVPANGDPPASAGQDPPADLAPWPG